jgi:hypothetical protein
VRIIGRPQVGILAIAHSVPIGFCFFTKQYVIKEFSNGKSSTGRIEHEYCNRPVKEVAHIANGRDTTLHCIWFAIPVMQIH